MSVEAILILVLSGIVSVLAVILARAFGRDSATREVMNLLGPPQPRGALGEVVLSESLRQVLPGNLYKLQHRFENGKRVDAVVQVGDRLLPIDAKFPLQAFKNLTEGSHSRKGRRDFVRAITGHVDTIANSYIQGSETLDFALMYIPAEGIYTEILNANSDLIDHALKQRVIPVSPLTLYAYLRLIAWEKQRTSAQDRVPEILDQVAVLGDEILRLHRIQETLTQHLRNATNKQHQATTALEAIHQHVKRAVQAPEIDPSPPQHH